MGQRQAGQGRAYWQVALKVGSWAQCIVGGGLRQGSA